MESSRKRSCSGDGFTPDEMVVADILAHFTYYSSRFFPQWGSKRKRSTNSILHANNAHQSNIKAKYRASPTTPLNLSWSEPEDFEADPPSFARRLPSASRVNSKNKRLRKAPLRRCPKKKTHGELKEMVNALSLERDRLKKEEEQLLKTYHDLREWNERLKSQLALYLDLRRVEKLQSTPHPTSSDPDSAQETEASSSFDLSLRRNEQKHCGAFAGTLPFISSYNEPLSVESSKNLHCPKSPSGSEKGQSPIHPNELFWGVPDLNTSVESLSDIVPNGSNDQMFQSKGKTEVAAEARKRRIELTRSKYAQYHKAGLRCH